MEDTDVVDRVLLVEVDSTAEFCIEYDFKLFHSLFTIFCSYGKGGKLGCDFGLVLF
jgi:hypothetical protein